MNLKHLFDPKKPSTINIIKTNQVKQATIARRDLNDLLSVKVIDNNTTTVHLSHFFPSLTILTIFLVPDYC